MIDKENAAIIGYMCKVDFEYELGESPLGNLIFPTLDDLREYRPCVQQDGIVEVEVRLKRIIQEENFGDASPADQ